MRQIVTGSRRSRLALLLVATFAVGYLAAWGLASALPGRPAVAGPAAGAYGPAGDGNSRFVVTSATGPLTNGQLAALRAAPGVVSAQMLTGGSALVAASGTTVQRLASAAPGLRVAPSPQGRVTDVSITDPYWSSYGWNLSNTGSNAYQQSATPGADDAAPAGWQTSTGRGEIVAVVDTGMDTAHTDLQGALWSNPAEACGSTDTDQDGYAGDCHGWNFYANNADVTNSGGDDSHGTAVAGAVGARLNNGQGTAGVAPDVQIMPLVIGSGGSVDLTLGAQAIRYAADHGAAVVNASWIGSGGASVLQDAIDYANSKGTVVVAAAGNDSADRDTDLMYPASLTAPNLIKVGASTAGDGISSFSAYGSSTVDLFAPGTLVYTTWNDGGYMLVNGTSIASPQVAAAAALYRARNPSQSPAQIKADLLADSTKLPAFAGKSVSGGRLSLTSLGSASANSAVLYSFDRMRYQTAGTVAPTVTVSGAAGSGDFTVRLGLGELYRGEVYAVGDQPLTLADGTTLTTGSDGLATVDLGQLSSLGAVTLVPTTTLGEGQFVLLAQAFKDGVALTGPSVAPLLIGQAALTAPTPAPSGGSAPPVTPTGGSAQPTGSASSSAQPSGSQPSGSQPTGAQSSQSPSSTSVAQPTSSGGSTAPLSSAAAPTSALAAPTSTAGLSSTASSAAAPTTAGAQPTGSAGPTGSAPAPSSPTGSGPAPSGKTYPPTGPFQLTSISPSVVSTAGGTTVTVTGNAVPAGARVRIGLNDAATVLSSSSTSVSFTSPALVAGTYDVYVFSADGQTVSVLAGGLTYVAPSSVPGSGPSSPTASSPAAPTSSGAAPSTVAVPPSSTTTPDPNAPAPTPQPPTTTAYIAGPNGEHLYHSPLFGTLPTSVWGQDCSGACGGLQL